MLLHNPGTARGAWLVLYVYYGYYCYYCYYGYYDYYMVTIWSPCRTTGHFLLLVFDDFESSLTILSLGHLVYIMGSSPLDMSLKRVSAMDYNSF